MGSLLLILLKNVFFCLLTNRIKKLEYEFRIFSKCVISQKLLTYFKALLKSMTLEFAFKTKTLSEVNVKNTQQLILEAEFFYCLTNIIFKYVLLNSKKINIETEKNFNLINSTYELSVKLYSALEFIMDYFGDLKIDSKCQIIKRKISKGSTVSYSNLPFFINHRLAAA